MKHIKKEVAYFKDLFEEGFFEGDANGDLHSAKRYREMLVRVRNYESGHFA